MKSIVAKLAKQSRLLMLAESSIVDQTNSPRASEALKSKEQRMVANKMMFATIFNEAAPNWWGDFDVVKL